MVVDANGDGRFLAVGTRAGAILLVEGEGELLFAGQRTGGEEDADDLQIRTEGGAADREGHADGTAEAAMHTLGDMPGTVGLGSLGAGDGHHPPAVVGVLPDDLDRGRELADEIGGPALD